MATNTYIPRLPDGMIEHEQWPCYHCGATVGKEKFRASSGYEHNTGSEVWACCDSCNRSYDYAYVGYEFITFKVNIIGGLIQ